MVLAYHCIFGMYGFWLPNDPRGSGSDYIGSYDLFRYGHATKTDSHQSVANAKHNPLVRHEPKFALRYTPVEISGEQAVTIAEGFRQASLESNYRIYACAILPAHVHLVIANHERNIRRIVGHLRGRATMQLKKKGMWTQDERPIWGEHGWNVFLLDERAVLNAIAYVENNPVKEGLRRQRWSLVEEFNSGPERGASTRG